MTSFARIKYCLVFLTALLGLAGCAKKDDSESETSLGSYEESSEVVRSSFGPSLAAAARPDKRVTIVAKFFVPITSRGLDNTSTGIFKTQVRIAFSELKGLTSGQSMAFLRLIGPGGSEFYNIGGRYTKGMDGTDSFFVFSQLDNGSTTLPVFYAGAHEVDLQIEQTATDLTLSSRVPPDLGGNGVWNPQGSQARSPDNPFYLSIGMSNVGKKGKFYYSDFRLAGAGIGGVVEGGINVHLQNSVDAIQAAQAAIKANPPDLTGALANLDTAISAAEDAATDLSAALTARTLEGTTFGKRASTMLIAAGKKLKTIRTTVATQNVKKARIAGNGLPAVIGNMEGAMGNLLGAKAPNLKSKPAIFTWHTD